MTELLTNQEIFDKVYVHLLTQNQKSLVYGLDCVYRNEKGLKCAIGCLIPDEMYKPEYDTTAGLGALFVAFEDDMTKFGLNHEKHFDLLLDLQQIHDVIEIEYWKERLIDLAEKFELKAPKE